MAEAVHAPGEKPQALGSGLARLRNLIGLLDRNQRTAGLAALALIVSEFFPWYSGDLVLAGQKTTVLRVIEKRSALGAFSLVELALLLTAACVLALLYVRVDRRRLYLPMGDGTFIAGAGLWSAILIVYRMLDRPEIHLRGIPSELGLSWGILVALVAAIVLAVAGLSYHHPYEPRPRHCRDARRP